jgi:hypothetical protein
MRGEEAMKMICKSQQRTPTPRISPAALMRKCQVEQQTRDLNFSACRMIKDSQGNLIRRDDETETSSRENDLDEISEAFFEHPTTPFFGYADAGTQQSTREYRR